MRYMLFEFQSNEIDRLADAVAQRLQAPTKTQWLNRQEAAEHLRCTVKQIDTWVRRGEIRAYRPNSRPLFRADELDDFVLSSGP